MDNGIEIVKGNKKKQNAPAEYMKRHSKRRDKDLKYDFMPQMLEIIERPANKAGVVIIVGTLSLLVVFIIWASLSKTDVVVSSSGLVQPVGNLNVVQSYTSGTVKAINTEEGAYVEAGQVLVELDTQSLDIDVEYLAEQREILEVQQDIYHRILDGEDLSGLDVSAYDSHLQSYIQSILDADISYCNTLAALELEKDTAYLNKQIAQLQLEEYQANGTENQQKAQEFTIQQYTLEIKKVDLQITDTETQYRANIHSVLSQISSQLIEIDNNLEKYGLSADYQKLVAPVSGYVNSIEVNTVGELISSGQDVVTIVPGEAPLEIVCYVANMNIADIEVGMEAEMKLEAYPYNSFGTVKGCVKYISPSAFVSEQMGSVYLVKIEIIEASEQMDIISGLSGVVEIKIGERTILEYFMEPILEGFQESMHEK